MDTDSIYTCHQLQKMYNGRLVLDVPSLEIQSGEILALVGPSGAGKSTLLRLLAFLERPSAGRLVYRDRPVDERWPDLAARRRVTMVFQQSNLLRRSVWDNVFFGLKLRGLRGGDYRVRVTETLKEVGLEALMNARVNTLSGGEAQRVALARALVLDPAVLLLDEPTANLDPYNVNLIESHVRRANESGKTVVMVTHNIFQARRLAQRVGFILNSRLIEIQDVESFFEHPRHPETAAFVRGEMVY